MKIYSKQSKLGVYRSENFERSHLIEIVKSFSNTIGEVNEIVSGRWSNLGETGHVGAQLPASATKKIEIMNYLIESAITPQVGGQCPLKMIRIKDKDFLVDMVFPEPSQATNLSLGEEANCPQMILSSPISGD